MLIQDIHTYLYRLPFVRPFSTAHVTLMVREGAILVLTTEQGVQGLGEIAPFPELSGETLTEALDAFYRMLPQLRGESLKNALLILDEQSDLLLPSTMCGLEMALLDAMSSVGVQFIEPSSQFIESSSQFVEPLPPEWLAIRRAQVKVNAVIGASAIQDAIEAAVQVRANGFSCVKLKVGVGETARQELARIAAVRDALGPEIALRLDANEAWTVEQAQELLTQCVPFDIQYVEQPVKAHDIEGMRRLRTSVPIALAADEAARDRQCVRAIIEHEAADVLVLKPQLVGGLRACRDIIEEATRRDIACVLTTTIESGVTLAATLRLATSLPTSTLACGFGTLPLLVDDLICEQLPIVNGMMAVPAGSHWGVSLDEDALRSFASFPYTL